jgi:hypothetical protein
VKPVQVDVVAYAPTAFFHCQHCEIVFHHLGLGQRIHRSEADDALPPDLELDYLDLSGWVHDLKNRHGDRIAVRVIDAASIQGVWTSLRHRVRTYPAVIVGGRTKRVGGDYRQLGPVIDRLVGDGASQVHNTNGGYQG